MTVDRRYPLLQRGSYPTQTAAERAIGVAVTNAVWPECHVHRYGAIGDGVTDDLPAFQRAHNVAIQFGGTLTGLQRRYLLNGTLAITGPCGIDFFNSAISYTSPPQGAQLYSTTNAPILTYNSNLANHVSLRNINIVGGVVSIGFTASVGGATSGTLSSAWTGASGAYTTDFAVTHDSRSVTLTNGLTAATWAGALGAGTITSANVNLVGTSQDGIAITPVYPAQVPVYFENLGIFNCGRYGLHVGSSYGSTFNKMYVQGCASTGILDGSNSGANLYLKCLAVNNASAGFDLQSTNGSSHFFGCNTEQNNYGMVFESGCIDMKVYAQHSERNTTQSIWFKPGSSNNIVYGETVGASEPLPLNQGTANAYVGPVVVSGNVVARGVPRILQRVSTVQTAKVFGSALTAMTRNSSPTTGGGMQIFSLPITPASPGSRLKFYVEGYSSIHVTGTAFVALFQGSNCIAARSFAQTGDVPDCWAYAFDIASPSAGIAATYTVNLGSSTAADSITFGGANNVLDWGAGGTIAIGSMAIEEYIPAS